MDDLKQALGSGGIAELIETFPARGLHIYTKGEDTEEDQGFAATRTCPVCGKRFVLPCAASSYAWRVNVTEEMRAIIGKNIVNLTMCSYTCARKMDAQKAELHKEIIKRLWDKRREKKRRQKDDS